MLLFPHCLIALFISVHPLLHPLGASFPQAQENLSTGQTSAGQSKMHPYPRMAAERQSIKIILGNNVFH
jgi:hypothetical protein